MIVDARNNIIMQPPEDWRNWPQIKSIGPIPAHGCNYYDGVIDAYNDDYFITQDDEIYEWEDGKRVTNSYLRVYLVYKMTPVLKFLYSYHGTTIREDWEETMTDSDFKFPRSDGYIDADLKGSSWCSFQHQILMMARKHVESLNPIGYILESDLERVKDT